MGMSLLQYAVKVGKRFADNFASHAEDKIKEWSQRHLITHGSWGRRIIRLMAAWTAVHTTTTYGLHMFLWWKSLYSLSLNKVQVKLKSPLWNDLLLCIRAQAIRVTQVFRKFKGNWGSCTLCSNAFYLKDEPSLRGPMQPAIRATLHMVWNRAILTASTWVDLVEIDK